MDIAALASEHTLALWGGALVVLGFLVSWWSSRYDLKAAALDSAWQTARGNRSSSNPTEVEKRLKEITSQAGAAGKVTAAASTVIGHLAAQVLGLVALVMMLAGAGLIAADIWWK